MMAVFMSIPYIAPLMLFVLLQVFLTGAFSSFSDSTEVCNGSTCLKMPQFTILPGSWASSLFLHCSSFLSGFLDNE